MNELLDKDTSTMSIPELEKHIETTLSTLYNIMKKDSEDYIVLFKKGSWYSDNQSVGIRAGVMALYNLHVGEGELIIKSDADGKYSVAARRKNPINYYNSYGSGHHSFDSFDLALYINNQHNPSELVFEVVINESKALDVEANVKGRRFTDAYTLLALCCQGGRYGDYHAASFAKVLLKSDHSQLFEASIYNNGAKVLGSSESFTAYTLAYANPKMKFDSIREYIITDAIKETAFMNFIMFDNDKMMVKVTGNKELVRGYWAEFLTRNGHRLRDEFIKETKDVTKQAMLEALGAQDLGKVI